jgi:hypothetical protein
MAVAEGLFYVTSRRMVIDETFIYSTFDAASMGAIWKKQSTYGISSHNLLWIVRRQRNQDLLGAQQLRRCVSCHNSSLDTILTSHSDGHSNTRAT